MARRKKEENLHRKNRPKNGRKNAVLAVVLATSPAVFADGQKASGTVVVVAEEVATVKGADGKTYMIKVADIVAEDLKTGDIVEYELVEGKPVKAKIKARAAAKYILHPPMSIPTFRTVPLPEPRRHLS